MVFALPVLFLGASAAAEDEVTVRGKKPSTLAAAATEGDMPRETSDLASLIAPLPGVYVRRQGPDDSLSTLSIRGTSPQQAAVYLAGVPVTGGGDPAMDLSLLPVWPRMQARVYRTFAPAALGRPALGGALVLDAPTLATEPGATEVYAGIGSYGAARARAGQVAQVGTAKVAVAAFGSRADNGFSYLDPVASSPERSVYRDRQNAGHAAAGAVVEAAIPVRLPLSRTRGTLTATAYGQWRKQQIPGTVRLPTPYQELESGRTLGSVDLAVPFAAGTAHVQVFERYDTLSLRDQAASARISGSPVRANDAFLTLGLRAGARQEIGKHTTATVHADALRESYLPGARVAAGAAESAGRSSLGLAAELESAPVSRVRGALHGRLDGFADSGADGPQKSALLPTGHFTVDVKLAEGLSWIGRIGRTARVPSFLERFGNQGIFVGDPDLRPESAWTQDAGVRGTLGTGTKRGQLEVVGFHTSAVDLIQFVPQGAFGRSRATNLGQADLAGVELLGQLRYGVVDVRAVYNFLLTANRTLCDAARGPGVCASPPLPGRPRHALTTDAGIRIGPVTLRYGVDVVSGMLADLLGTIRVPSRALQNAGVRVQATRNLLVGADLRNLANVRTGSYAGALGTVQAPIGDQYDYPLPGRTLLFFARLSAP